MSIVTKIEQIRQKPEHIRIRYVWGCVGISMLIIVTIWIFSVASLFQTNKNTQTSTDNGNSVDDLKNQLQNIQQQAPSLKDYTNKSLTVGQEGVNNTQQNSNDFQYPATNNNTNSDTTQSATYSNLSNSSQTDSAQQ